MFRHVQCFPLLLNFITLLYFVPFASHSIKASDEQNVLSVLGSISVLLVCALRC